MTAKQAAQAGGINVSGSVTSQGDLVGHDKIIYNIVLVGRFLEMADVEGLLPEALPPIDPAEAGADLGKLLSENLRSDLTKPVALVGEVLGDLLIRSMPANPLAALPFRRLFVEMAPHVVTKLKEMDYWDTFNQRECLCRWNHDAARGTWSSYTGNVIWLRSLEALGKRIDGWENLHGIAEVNPPGSESRFFFAKQQASEHLYLSPDTPLPHTADEIAPERIDNKFFRIFVTGFVLDLIRLASTASHDVAFWNEMTDLLATRSS